MKTHLKGIKRTRLVVSVGALCCLTASLIVGLPTQEAFGNEDGTGLAARNSPDLPFDNVGIGRLGEGDGDFDGVGNYLDRSELAEQGFAQGVNIPIAGTDLQYTLPVTTSGEADNVRSDGQTIALPNSWETATAISLIGASAFGGQSGAMALNFHDGTSRSVNVGLADWCSSTSPSYGNIPVALTEHRATGTGTGGGGCGIYATAPIELEPGEQPVSLTLPFGLTNMHVFAIAANSVFTGPQVIVDRARVSEGDVAPLVANGTGFPSGITLDAYVRPGKSPVGSVTADAQGAFSYDLPVTALDRGRYAVTFSDKDWSAAGGQGFTIVRGPVDPGDLGEPVSYVNTLIGTGNGGPEAGEINNFPGPAAPFGMVQYSPDTVDGYAGYVISDDRLKGYSMTHASVGCSAFGDFPMLPTTQDVNAQPWDQIERIDHGKTEQGEPGYYTVHQSDSGIVAELTAGTRVGVGRFDYPAGKGAILNLKAGSSKGGNSDASISIGDDGIVTGSSSSGSFCGKQNKYTVYFAMQFDHEITGYGTWDKNSQSVTAYSRTAKGPGVGGWVSFDQGAEVTVKTAISFVSAEGAKANLSEVAGQGFDEVRAANSEQWNETLSKITVSGTDLDDLEMFYTSLFHSLQHPNTFNDADGSYLGFDGKVHQVKAGHTQYSNFSDWDTYRSHVPLIAMLFPQQASDMAQSLVNAAEQSGSLPRWAIANSPTGQMTGDNVTPLIVNTYAYGATDFDAETALHYMVKAARDGGQSTTHPWYWQRKGAETYSELGYGPQTAEFKGDHQIVGASITLEWSVDDFSISRLAQALGKDELADEFQQRAQYWQNLLDPSSRYILPRDAFGAFLPAPDFSNPAGGIGQPGFDEGNAAQYTWMVPQNTEALVAGLGGRETVSKRLDDFFLELNAGSKRPYLWAGNEPDFGFPWLYNYIGEPAKTQKVVDRVRTELFAPTPNGKPGNDDLGAQSSWYVWAAMGLWPATPGTTVLALNTPVFDEVSVSLPTGETISISAPGASSAVGTSYIQSMTLDGVAYNKTSLPETIVADGGAIAYTVAGTTGSAWGMADDSAPPSYTEGGKPAVFAPDASITVAPGTEAKLGLHGQRLLSSVTGLEINATSPVEGVTVEDAALRFGQDGSAAGETTVSVDASVTEGFYTVEFSGTADGVQIKAASTLLVARPGGLVDAMTLVATAPKDNPDIGRFDSDGASFQREQLAAEGLAPGQSKEVNGTTFTWPLSPVGRPDAVEPHRQRIELAAPTSLVTLIGASRNGGQEAEGLAWLDDGTSVTLTVGLDDWVGMSGPGGTPGYGGTVVARMTDRNSQWGGGNAQIYATTPFAAPEGRTIVAVTLPEAERQRIFAIGTDTPVETETQLTASTTAVMAGDTVILAASVTPDTVAGVVRFTDGGRFDQTVRIENGKANVDVQLTTAGARSFTATFTADEPRYQPSTSDALVLELPSPSIDLSPGTVAAGGKVIAKVRGYLPGESVTASLNPDGFGARMVDGGVSAASAIPVGSVIVSEDGTATLEVAVPAGTVPGKYLVQVTGVDSGLASQAKLAVVAVGPDPGVAQPGGGTGVPGSESGGLPITGSEAIAMGAAAVLTMLLGGALVAWRRMRRRHG